MSNLEASSVSSRKSAAAVNVLPSASQHQANHSQHQATHSPPEKQRSAAPAVMSPSSTVQVLVKHSPSLYCFSLFTQSRLGDVKKRLDSKLSELINVQVPSSTKAVSDQQVTRMPAKFIHCSPQLHVESFGALFSIACVFSSRTPAVFI